MSRSRPRVLSRCSFQMASARLRRWPGGRRRGTGWVRQGAGAAQGAARTAVRSASRAGPLPQRARHCGHGRCSARCWSPCRFFRPRCWRAGAGRHRRRWRCGQTPPARRRIRHAPARGAPRSGGAGSAPGWCRRSTARGFRHRPRPRTSPPPSCLAGREPRSIPTARPLPHGAPGWPCRGGPRANSTCRPPRARPWRWTGR